MRCFLPSTGEDPTAEGQVARRLEEERLAMNPPMCHLPAQNRSGDAGGWF